jgi:hypothetical protein
MLSLSRVVYIVLRRRIHIADIGETFGTQQLLGDVLGGLADPRVLDNANGGRFQRSLRGQRSRRANEPAAPANERVARKRRRDCIIGIGSLPFLNRHCRA